MNVETLFGRGSKVNMISKSLVKKLGLETKPNPKPQHLVACVIEQNYL